MSSIAAELVVSILELWHCWRSPETESLVTGLFTLEEYERMSCRKCRLEPNYPEQSSYGIVVPADSIRDLKSAFGNINFEDILMVIRMEDKMLCDIKTGVLEWEKNETENKISETTKALEWEIDMSRLCKGLEPNTKYHLVSMVGCGEDKEHILLTLLFRDHHAPESTKTEELEVNCVSSALEKEPSKVQEAEKFQETGFLCFQRLRSTRFSERFYYGETYKYNWRRFYYLRILLLVNVFDFLPFLNL